MGKYFAKFSEIIDMPELETEESAEQRKQEGPGVKNISSKTND